MFYVEQLICLTRQICSMLRLRHSALHSLYIQEIYFTLHSLDLNLDQKFLYIFNDQFGPEAKILISSSSLLRFENVFRFFHAWFHCSELWSSPVSNSEAILTRTAVGMKYFIFTSVAAMYHFRLQSARFTTLAFSFVPGKIHRNCTKRAACPAALCNGSGLHSSTNWNVFDFRFTRDSPVCPISCPSHVTKQQYGDCEKNRISHRSEKRTKGVH